MQRVTLLSIGTLKEPWAKAACASYLARMREMTVEVVELPPSKEKDAKKQAADESARLLAAARKLKAQLWVLDERGERMTSVQCAEAFCKSKDRGEAVVLLLGGAYGLTDDVRGAAAKILRLSDMTLPHELCRVVLLEQLYRAQEIGKGSGYHHV